MNWLDEMMADWEKWLNPYYKVPAWQVAAAALFCIALVIYIGRKDWLVRKRRYSLGLGLFWLYTILCATIFGRNPGKTRLELELFWCIRAALATGHWTYWYYIIGNILLFVPMGFFMGRVAASKKGFGIGQAVWIIGLCFLCSAGIEGLQYAGGLGLCELDDVFHNTLGGMMGYLFSACLEKTGNQPGESGWTNPYVLAGKDGRAGE